MESGIVGMNAVNVTILGEDRVQQMFATAPRAFARSMTHWLWRERKSFVGNRRHMGSFRRTLLRKKRKSYDGTWSQGMARAFTGKVNHPERLSNLQLSLGISDKWQERIPYLEKLSEQHTITPKNRQWLMLPFYENLRSVGLFGRVGGFGMGKTKSHWGRVIQMLYNSSRITPILFHGKLLFFGDTAGEAGSHRGRHLGRLHKRLLFVGVKKVSIKKQYDFLKAFQRRVPGIIKRANNMVDRTMREIDRGVSKGFYQVK